jgi:DNA-binding CsgD family transcriptional regulator
VEVVQDHESTVELVQGLRGRARHQVRSLVGGAGLPSLVQDPVPEPVGSLLRDVAHRTVYDADVLRDGSRLASIARCAERGEQSRSFGGVPLTMLVSDDEAALIVLPERGGTASALAVYPSGLLDGLIELFESFWRIGLPMAAPQAGTGTRGRSAGPGSAATIDADELRLMQLLATGLTDGVVARTMGVSERTLHRRLSRLQQRMGVQSRFQLGLHAARQGWL